VKEKGRRLKKKKMTPASQKEENKVERDRGSSRLLQGGTVSSIQRGELSEWNKQGGKRKAEI